MYSKVLSLNVPQINDTVLPDAPIVIVRASAWFIINLFISLLVQIANKMDSQKKIFVALSAAGRKPHRS
jgi:hypothetical protein